MKNKILRKGKYLILTVLLLLTLSCRKNEIDVSAPVQSSTTTLVFTGANQDGLVRVCLIDLTTEITGQVKNSVLKGRLIKFNFKSSGKLDNTLNSTSYDLEKNQVTDRLVSTFIEDRLKLLSGYTQSTDISKEEILSLLKTGEAELATIEKSNINLFDFFTSLLVSPAYAQNTKRDKIILSLLKSLINQAKDCISSNNEKCNVSICETAKATADLWSFVANEVDKALNPQTSNSAKLIYDHICGVKTTSLIVTEGNSQVTSPSSIGGSHGDPHLISMDGLNYDFQGYGEFIAVKSVTDNFEIQVRQEEILPYKNGKVTMSTGLAINLGKDIVCIYPTEIYVNKQKFTLSLSGQKDYTLNKGSLSQSNNLLTLQSTNNDIIRVYLQNLGQGFLDFRVNLNENRKGKVQGLLGNYDGNRTNDTQLQDNKTINPYIFTELYPVFADRWRISQNNSLFEYSAGKNTLSFTKSDYPKQAPEIDENTQIWAEGVCRSNGITEEPYLSSCVMDVALSGSEKFTISAFIAEENKFYINGFDVKKFTSFPQLNIISHGNALIENGVLYLTKSKGNQAGAIFQKYKTDISNGFEVNIDFSFTEYGGSRDAKGEIGADGFTFIIQDYDSRLAPLVNGGALGYDGFPRSFVIEFDTYTNSWDSPDTDIWLNTQGTKPNSVNDSKTIIKPQTRKITNLVDGKLHQALIRYTKKTIIDYKIEVFLDGDSTPYLIADNINIQNIIGAFNSGVYLGLTAATAAGYQNHIIHRWAYKPL